jgi:hypothetical protein
MFIVVCRIDLFLFLDLLYDFLNSPIIDVVVKDIPIHVTNGYKSNNPKNIEYIIPEIKLTSIGILKFNNKVDLEVFFHDNNGPTPIKNNNAKPIGTLS